MPLILKPQQSQMAVSIWRTDPYCHIWWKCYRLSAQGTETDLSTPAWGMQWAARGATASTLSRMGFLSSKRKVDHNKCCQLLVVISEDRVKASVALPGKKQCEASARMKGRGVGLPLHVHNKVPRGNMWPRASQDKNRFHIFIWYIIILKISEVCCRSVMLNVQFKLLLDKVFARNAAVPLHKCEFHSYGLHAHKMEKKWKANRPLCLNGRRCTSGVGFKSRSLCRREAGGPSNVTLTLMLNEKQRLLSYQFAFSLKLWNKWYHS